MKALFVLNLLASGIAAVSLVAATDVSPPELRELTFSPAVIDTSASNQTITVTARLIDDLSGIDEPTFELPYAGGGSMQFSSPSRNQSIGVSLDWRNRVSGNAIDGVYSSAMTVPKLSEPGIWTLEYATLMDAMGNWRQMDLAQFLRLDFPNQFIVQGTGDITPPELREINLTPAVIDTSLSNQTLMITARLVDDLCGVGALTSDRPGLGRAMFEFSSPSKNQFVNASMSGWDRVSGDEHDGMYTGSMRMPRFSEPGVWTLVRATLRDDLGNRRQMDLAQFLRLGLPGQFVVQGTGDVTPPELREWSLSPTVIDTSRSNQTIMITVRLVDDLIGMGDPTNERLGGTATIQFSSPSKNQSVSVSLYPWNRVSGNGLDGVYAGAMTVPKLSEPGVWTLAGATLMDALGNSKQMDLAQFIWLGFPSQFVIQGTGDVTPPELREWSLSPTVIDTSRSNQTIMITARLIDDLSGIAMPISGLMPGGQIQVTWLSPSKNQSATVWCGSMNRISGNDLDGVYVGAMTLPRLSEPGVWTLDVAELRDTLGNVRQMDLAQFLALDFPMQFLIVNSPSLGITRSSTTIFLFWPAWATRFSLQSADRLGDMAPWTAVPNMPIQLGQEMLVELPISPAHKFYRLRAE
jgi:hypothetical protein